MHIPPGEGDMIDAQNKINCTNLLIHLLRSFFADQRMFLPTIGVSIIYEFINVPGQATAGVLVFFAGCYGFSRFGRNVRLSLEGAHPAQYLTVRFRLSLVCAGCIVFGFANFIMVFLKLTKTI
jgi:hypothetical protein